MVTGISEGTIARTMDLLDVDLETIAGAVGCTKGTLLRWRRGAQNPSPEFLKKLRLIDAFLWELQKRARSRGRAREWFDTRVPALGNRTPRQLFGQGNLAHLVVYLRQHERI